jgi:hypothetical protein
LGKKNRPGRSRGDQVKTYVNSSGRSSLPGLLNQTLGRIGGDGTLAQPVLGASDIEDERLRLGLGSVRAEELDRGTITAGTGLSHDNVVDGFMDGADARETDFEGHVKWF